MTSGDGPINRIPASTHASAKSDRSDKNPYPGWIASTPFSCQKIVSHLKNSFRVLCPMQNFRIWACFHPLFKIKEQNLFMAHQ